MDFLCSFNIWPILTLLFQGAVAGLIVMRVTKWMDAKKAKELTRKHAMLVYLEIKEHALLFDHVLKNNAISAGMLSLYLDTESWEISREHLTGLPLNELLHLGTYYRTVKQINTLLDACNGSLNPLIKESLDRGFLMCQAMSHLLAAWWDQKNAQTHAESYRKLYEQASRLK